MMKLSSAAIAVAVLAFGAVPAMAAPFCIGGGNRPGVHVSLSFHVGDEYTQSEIATFDLMALRKLGIDATRVERWNGCLRAFVREENGHEAMQFYDPITLERVY